MSGNRTIQYLPFSVWHLGTLLGAFAKHTDALTFAKETSTLDDTPVVGVDEQRSIGQPRATIARYARGEAVPL